MASASATVLASGFSHSTCLPASSAAMAISACESPGVHTSMSCTSSRLDQGAPVGLGGRPAVAARRGRAPPPRPGRTARPAGPQRQVEDVRGGAPGLRVGRAHERVADHAHAQRGRSAASPPRSSRQADVGCRALGSQSAGSASGTSKAVRTGSNVSAGDRAGDASMVSSTCRASSPEARCGRRRAAPGPCPARRGRGPRWPRRPGCTVQSSRAGGADPDLAAEPVRVGQGQRRLGAGDLHEAVPPQRRVEAEHDRRRRALRVPDQRGDVGRHLHPELVPARGPRPMTRPVRLRRPSAATCSAGPNTVASVVR